MYLFKNKLFIVLCILLLAIIASGCAAPPEVTPPEVQTAPEATAVVIIEYVEVTVVVQPTPLPPEPTPLPPPPPDHSVQLAAWQSSAHGNTYGFGKGPNTYCSRCHSPQNWDPASTVDAAPNCVTCKFPFDPDLRIASTMDFVSEEDWVGINCDTCHRVEDGVVQQGLAWYNVLKEEHQTVLTPNELCTKCHLTSQGVSYTGGRGVTHEIYLGGSAHKNWAGMITDEVKPQYCTDCHDPHTQTPKQCVDCHAINEAEHAMGQYPNMKDLVTCMACHEASGMEVGPHPEETMGGIWVPILTEVGRSGLTTTAVVSHSIQWLVACDRCHAEGNSHGLIALMADGTIAPEPEPEDGE